MDSKTELEQEAALRRRMRGEPDVTKEDTLTELREDLKTVALRDQLKGVPGVAPEDTRAELLDDKNRSAGRQLEKEQEADAMRADRIERAKRMTEEQAKAQVAADVDEHASVLASGPKWAHEAFYLRNDMAERMQANPVYAATLEATAPELARRVAENQQEDKTVNVAENLARARDEEAKATVDAALDKQLDDELRRRKAREAELAGQGLNTVDVQRSGRELERGEFIMPRQVAKNYTEVDGKFFTKDAKRPVVMFEDKGDKLATSTTDKQAISDMVTLAKAKQWDSLKLAGSQEFRREAWLQAESQGIKTQGYTPKQADLAALETLRQDRSTNLITPVKERQSEREHASTDVKAPRHDLNKNQASLHAEATKAVASNMQALQKNPAMADRSLDEVSKLAYWRGIVAEENKRQPQGVKDEALARFDKQAEDPKFLQRLERETQADVQQQTTERVTERVHTRTTQELSL